MPLVLLVVGLILAAVLRALVAPLYLIVTVVLSFAGDPRPLHLRLLRVSAAKGIAFNLVLLSFIFLVALGVDYNIFLMTRAREEAAAPRHPRGDAASRWSTPAASSPAPA